MELLELEVVVAEALLEVEVEGGKMHEQALDTRDALSV